MNKKDYNYLDKSFTDERNDAENRFGKALDLVYGENSKEKKIKGKAVRFSITIPEDNSLFVSSLRSQIAEPDKGFYPTISDIFSLGIESLKKLKLSEINELVESIK